jgi:methionyl-tRNA synthetase
MSKILINTAISYTNGDPHIGHLYESVLADFLKKSFGLFSNVKLLTGTDEHGKKIESTAKTLLLSPIELCNLNSQKFKSLNDKLNVDYNHFIRTTDDIHKSLVKGSLLKSNQSNDIYLSEYSGYYNVREECFVSEIEANQTNYNDPMTGKPYEKVVEESYYFKLEKYKDHVLNLLDKKLIFPANNFSFNNRVNELKDLSISRTSFDWGIDFPQLESQQKHIVYVWFDALLNYVTGSKILYEPEEQFSTIHLIGKDIIWFHSVIYPAILKSCGYDKYQASNILVHGFILDKDGIKMSKSLNNVIDVNYLIDKYPIDAIRYYLIMETVWGEDIKFNEERIKELYNNQLIKSFGNLFQRVFTLVKPIQNEINQKLIDYNYQDKKLEFMNKIEKIIKEYNHPAYKDELLLLCHIANKELTDFKPWNKLISLENKIQLLINQIVYLNFIMILLSPIIPNKIKELIGYLGWDDFDTLKLNILVDKIKAFNLI